jgi:hypothetical protein
MHHLQLIPSAFSWEAGPHWSCWGLADQILGREHCICRLAAKDKGNPRGFEKQKLTASFLSSCAHDQLGIRHRLRHGYLHLVDEQPFCH